MKLRKLNHIFKYCLKLNTIQKDKHESTHMLFSFIAIWPSTLYLLATFEGQSHYKRDNHNSYLVRPL